MEKKISNKNLLKANKQKNDEFYTIFTDIDKELENYTKHFKNKVVLCNCDDPRKSNFWKYFFSNFERLKLKKLISIHYEKDKHSYKLEVVKKYGKIRKIKTQLRQNGDFRNNECIKILKQSDIVVTNPPFSLFKEYIAQLVEYNKKFIIIGNLNAITQEETFRLIKDNKMWLGYNCVRHFEQPDGTMYEAARSYWYTNLDITKLHKDFPLYKKYSSVEYKKYDNYDVINVNKTENIPMDYKGVMGVPITFLDKLNPEQFRLLGIANNVRWIGHECITIVNGKDTYNRLLIRII